MVEEYEDTSKHAVPRLLPPKKQQDEPNIEEPSTPEPKTPGIEDRKTSTRIGNVHIQEEEEEEEEEETILSATPAS